MQGGYSGQILKRGVHFAATCLKHKQAASSVQPVVQVIPQDNSIEEILNRLSSPIALAIFGSTLFLFFLFSCSADYTINTVITNLAMVEDTDGGRTIVPATSNEPDAPLEKKPLMEEFEGKDLELPAGEALPTQPITRKLRTAILHLHSVGGFRARFRGLRFAAFYHIVLTIFSAIFQAMLSPLGPLGFWLGATLAAVASCNVHATWTHATIAEPSNKGFFKRFLSRSDARQLMLPTIRLHMAIGIMQVFTVGSAALAISIVQNEQVPRYLSINLFLLPVLVAISTALLAVLPSYIALVRAEASLLPEDENAIVPFDRTFGGRLLQEYTSRCAKVFQNFSMRGAWLSFDRETFRRVVKVQVKFFMIATMITLSFAAMLFAELYFLAGGEEALIKIVEYVRQHENL